jgi:kinetochore protein Spc24
LKKELKKAKLDALRPANQPTEMAHNAEVDRLERDYTQCGKQLKEEEAGVSRKQSELSRWKVDKEEVGKIQVGDEGAWADGKVYVSSSLVSFE